MMRELIENRLRYKKNISLLSLVLVFTAMLSVMVIPIHAQTGQFDWVIEGNNFFNEGKYQEALQAYDQALAEDSTRWEAWNGKGNVYFFLSQMNQALQSYDKALSIRSDISYLWTGKGEVLSHLNRQEEAIQAFDHAISLNSNDDIAWHGKGNALQLLGKYDEALQAIDRSLAINPNGLYSWTAKGHILRALGREQEAIQAFTRILVLAVKPGDFGAKAQALFALQRHREALQAYDELLATNPYAWWAWNDKGDILIQLGRNDEAFQAYDQAILLNPSNIQTLLKKGSYCWSLSRYQEGLQTYEQVLSTNPTNSEALQGKGQILLTLGRCNEALPVFEKGLVQNSGNIAAWTAKGHVYSCLRRWDEALAAYNQALSLNSQFINALSGKGWVLLSLNKPQEAAPVFEQVLSLTQNPSDPYSWYDRAHALKGLQRFEEALDACNQSIALNSNLSYVWMEKGSILLKLGRYQEAIQAFDRVLQLNPGDSEAISHRESAIAMQVTQQPVPTTSVPPTPLPVVYMFGPLALPVLIALCPISIILYADTRKNLKHPSFQSKVFSLLFVLLGSLLLWWIVFLFSLHAIDPSSPLVAVLIVTTGTSLPTVSSFFLAYGRIRGRMYPLLNRFHAATAFLTLIGALMLSGAPNGMDILFPHAALVACLLTILSFWNIRIEEQTLRRMKDELQEGMKKEEVVRQNEIAGGEGVVPPSYLAAPEQLSNLYSEITFIGEGGFARVFRATRKSDGVVVALKIPRIDEKTSSFFVREITAWYHLNHPNIVKLNKVEIHPIPYLEMEYLPGIVIDGMPVRDLGHYPKPLKQEFALTLIQQVAAGLRYAHAKEVYHHDLKPLNVLITGELSPKITDFGLARIASRDSISTPGGYSPLYAAPEQLDEETYGRPDGRTDLFQLGVIFHELLTNSLPFQGSTSASLMGKIIAPDVKALLPSYVNPGLAKYDGIVERLLAKRKEHRFQTVDEFLLSLESLEHLEKEKGEWQKSVSASREHLARSTSKDEIIRLRKEIVDKTVEIAVLNAMVNNKPELVKTIEDLMSLNPAIREDLHELIAQLEYMVKNGIPLSGEFLEMLKISLNRVQRGMK